MVQSENDLNKGVDNEDGVLSAEDTGNAEGTIVNEDRAEDTGNAEDTIVSEDCEEPSSETGGVRRRVVRENSVSTEEQREDPVVSKQVQKSGRMPKPNSIIKIRLDNDSVWVKAKVLSFQPKRTRGNKDWLNIHVVGDEKPQSID